MLTLQLKSFRRWSTATASRTLSRCCARSEEMKTLPGDERRYEALSKAVDRVNAELSVIERVRRFILADEPFSVENDQLTPSMKIRRHIIRKIYGERLDTLYKR